jgi:hypothetical protein
MRAANATVKAATNAAAPERPSRRTRSVSISTPSRTSHRQEKRERQEKRQRHQQKHAPRSRRPAPARGTRKAARPATRGSTRGKRPAPPRAPLPREVAIKALDPLRKCGPNTSVLHMFRVDESFGGAHAVTHLVFFDRHGWYCVHGRTCRAVEDVRKLGSMKHVDLDYNGRMRA